MGEVLLILTLREDKLACDRWGNAVLGKRSSGRGGIGLEDVRSTRRNERDERVKEMRKEVRDVTLDRTDDGQMQITGKVARDGRALIAVHVDVRHVAAEILVAARIDIRHIAEREEIFIVWSTHRLVSVQDSIVIRDELRGLGVLGQACGRRGHYESRLPNRYHACGCNLKGVRARDRDRPHS